MSRPNEYWIVEWKDWDEDKWRLHCTSTDEVEGTMRLRQAQAHAPKTNFRLVKYVMAEIEESGPDVRRTPNGIERD